MARVTGFSSRERFNSFFHKKNHTENHLIHIDRLINNYQFIHFLSESEILRIFHYQVLILVRLTEKVFITSMNI